MEGPIGRYARASLEDMRSFRLHLSSSGAGTPKINAIVSAAAVLFQCDARSAGACQAPVVHARATQGSVCPQPGRACALSGSGAEPQIQGSARCRLSSSMRRSIGTASALRLSAVRVPADRPPHANRLSRGMDCRRAAPSVARTRAASLRSLEHRPWAPRLRQKAFGVPTGASRRGSRKGPCPIRNSKELSYSHMNWRRPYRSRGETTESGR